MSVLPSDAPTFSAERWTKLTGLVARWSGLPLRLVIGYGFVVHGYAKLMRGPENFAVVLQVLNVPAPLFFAWATTITELIGGLCVLGGVFVSVASVPLSVVLLSALFTVHLPYGFFSVKLAEVSSSGIKFGPVGYEHILLYLAGLISLAAGGSGPFSFDAWRAREEQRM